MIPDEGRRQTGTEARRAGAKQARLAACVRVTILGVVIALTACRPAATGAAENAVRSTRERGPMRLVVEAWPPELLIGDTVRVRVAFDGPAELDVELPTEQAFGELAVKIADTPTPRPGQKGLLRQREFVVEPLEPGEVAVPALVVKYGPAVTTQPATRPVSEPLPSGELTSEALKVTVKSSLKEGEGPSQPRDITGTLTPPAPPVPLWVKLTIAAGILVACAIVYWAYRVLRARALRPPPPIPPDRWALGQLEGLSAPDPANRPLLASYYYRLTEIVRAYIERQYGLRAPDMTTEEFLVHVSRDRHGERYQVEHLRAFLEACDLVKYAAWTPTREDSASALTTARRYVQETAAAQRRAMERGESRMEMAPVQG